MKQFLLLVIIFCITANVCVAQNTRVPILEHAKSGDVKSMLLMAFAYENGIGGFEKNYSKAIYWKTKAAGKGDVSSMYTLGIEYLSGEHIKQDKNKGLNWLIKAADKGCYNAMNTLGVIYYKGVWLNKDEKKAKYWFDKSNKSNGKCE